MAGGGAITQSSSRAHLYTGGLNAYMVFVALLAGAGGLLFGYDIGESGREVGAWAARRGASAARPPAAALKLAPTRPPPPTLRRRHRRRGQHALLPAEVLPRRWVGWGSWVGVGVGVGQEGGPPREPRACVPPLP